MITSTKNYEYDVLGTEDAVVESFFVKDSMLVIPAIYVQICEHELNSTEKMKYLPPILLRFENVSKFHLFYYDKNRLLKKIKIIDCQNDNQVGQDGFGFWILDGKIYLEFEISSDNKYLTLQGPFDLSDSKTENVRDILFQMDRAVSVQLPDFHKFKFSDYLC